MTDTVLVSLITSISGVCISGMAAYFAYKAKTQSNATHTAVNSRMDELLKMAKESFTAQGKLEGNIEGVQKQKEQQASNDAFREVGKQQQKDHPQ
jgi:hypothetical protein